MNKQGRFDQAVNSSSMSALAEIAVEDMERLIDTPHYTPNYGVWLNFESYSPKKCKACLAGAVMLFTNGARVNSDVNKFVQPSWAMALEDLRQGDLFSAYQHLTLLSHEDSNSDEYNIVRNAVREMSVDYTIRWKHSNFGSNKKARRFVNDLKRIIPKLRKVDERIAAGMDKLKERKIK